MNADTREQVRSNAKYLRNVRPIDPDEIAEYVEGQPHPGVVRQILREEAFDLELVEEGDGTFRPVDDESIEPRYRTVEALPERYARRLEGLLVDRFGPGWPEGESGDRLRETIRRLKAEYFRQHPVEYEYDVALGYAVYHLPDYYAAIQYVLDDLAGDRLLPRRLRILDVGAGVGGPALGIFEYLPDDALVEYRAVEPSAAADVLAAMLEETGDNVHTSIARTTAESFEPDDEYDLVLFANVLSELDDPVSVARRYFETALAPDGSFVAIAPADENTSTGLRSVERSLEDEYTVYGPTVRLWPGERPTDRGWSFDVKPDLAVPSFQERLDDGTGEFVNVDVQYSHSILRTDGRRRYEFTPDRNRFAKMASMDEHVTNRIDLVAAKLSHSLSEDGNPLFKVSDGSESIDHYAVLTRETTLNRGLIDAEYGELLKFERTLALWNEDEEAYNLVVDDETIVDRIPA